MLNVNMTTKTITVIY